MTSQENRIDFIECASGAYRFLWEKRVTVLRLSFLVIAAEIIFFAVFDALGLHDQHLRQGLLLIPVFFLEGWVIGQIVMMAMFSQAPEMMKTEDMPKNLKAGMIAYVLVKLMLSFLIGFTFQAEPQTLDGQPIPAATEPSVMLSIAMGVTTVFSIWAFRFIWLYAPIMAGKDVFDFLHRIRGFASSFSFLGIWILCFAPVLLFMILGSQIWIGFSGLLGQGEGSILTESGLKLVLIVADYAQALASSVGVGLAVCAIYGFAKDNNS